MLLSSAQARHALAEFVGRTIKPHEFYNLKTRGLLPVAEQRGRSLYFREQDVRTCADLLRKIDETPIPSGYLMTSQALYYLETHYGISMKRGAFLHRMKALQKTGAVPEPISVPYTGRPLYYYSPESLDTMAKFIKEEKHQGMLTTNEAAQYLSRKYERVITPDLLYHKVARKTLVPDEVIDNRYFLFKTETLDKLEIGSPRSGAPLPEREIKTIDHIIDIQRLEKAMGDKLIATKTVMQILKQRTGRDYTINAIKQMRRRGVLRPVARFGRNFLYSYKEANSMRVLPNTGRRPPEIAAPSHN